MPAPTVRVLLGRVDLALGLLTPEDALPRGALDAEASWVHSSDLADPTPFLTPGQMLLTTGTQFASSPGDRRRSSYPAGASSVDGYVTRLARSGVVALGFGTEVISTTPPGLVAACLRAGLPLLDVPYRTPFIAVARYAADLIAEQTYARNTWALAAQRAVSLAALRTDGLAATLAELSRQLARWVVLVDAAGEVERVFPAKALTASLHDTVSAEAQRMLRAGRRAASTVSESGTFVSLQTIGASTRLLGVLAHGGADEVDQAAQQVVTSVVALAGLALEQGRALDATQASLRSALLRSLDDADAIARELGDAAGLTGPDGVALERARSRVQEADRRASARQAQPTPAPPTAQGGLLGALEGAGARGQASAVLALLTAADRDGMLAESLLVWLEHNGVYDAAARELGVHRHTLTARIRSAEQALGRDFGTFADRAEIWAALRAQGQP